MARTFSVIGLALCKELELAKSVYVPKAFLDAFDIVAKKNDLAPQGGAFAYDDLGNFSGQYFYI